MQERRFEVEDRRVVFQSEVEKEKLKIEKEKLEDNTKQWLAGMNLKREEIELKRMEMDRRLDVRMLELQHEEKMMKMRLETEERLKRYELELKYKQ